ncbi:MAG TPA: hypothetical protein VEX62_11400 [Candidatus Limnocylindrales bacterium]|nr:hypothetical protein [Candidatus Limnocylindrales bacterium]
MTERASGYDGNELREISDEETGDGTNSSGQSGNAGPPSNDIGAVNRGGAGDSSSGNADGEEGGGPGTR